MRLWTKPQISQVCILKSLSAGSCKETEILANEVDVNSWKQKVEAFEEGIQRVKCF